MIFYNFNLSGEGIQISALNQSEREIFVYKRIEKRARNIAAPVNAQRFGLSTPCSKTGSCMDCKSPDTICCQFLVTRYSRHDDRIYVILVNDNLGF